MSVASKNPFAFLDPEADESPAPAPVKAAAPAPAAAGQKPAAKPAAQRTGARKPVVQGDREINADAANTNAKEDRAATFSRGGHSGRGRTGRGGANPRSNAGTYQGGARPRRENGGGRPFDRHSQTAHKDSEKAEEKGWGADEGKQELQAEQQGEADAKVEATPEGAATPAERAAPVEEEDNTQTYDEYLAKKAAEKLALASLPEARVANEGADDSNWALHAIAKKGEAEEEWFTGVKKTEAVKARKNKEKTLLEVDFSFKREQADGTSTRSG
ncbi:hypothetical protein MNV49_006598 [Pseudohyphozyma bogoriensis]|nr:hypothetical protein MNV49_006598 [Pseudohyphozyma bogoriensis]